MKVKIFSETNPDTLEEKVNNFLKENANRIKILFVTQSECEQYYTISIFYDNGY